MDGDETFYQPLPPLIKSASRTSIDEGVSWYHGKINRDAAEHILEISMFCYIYFFLCMQVLNFKFV